MNRILISMYIFGYFFQKWHFWGSSKKRADWQKNFRGASDPSAHPCSGGPVQVYSELCPALAYAETWYTRNPGIFRTLP